MACDTRLKPRQTIQERAVEVREATVRLAAALAAGRVQVKIGANGVPVFTGWDEQSRDGITDACAYRRIIEQVGRRAGLQGRMSAQSEPLRRAGFQVRARGRLNLAEIPQSGCGFAQAKGCSFA